MAHGHINSPWAAIKIATRYTTNEIMNRKTRCIIRNSHFELKNLLIALFFTIYFLWNMQSNFPNWKVYLKRSNTKNWPRFVSPISNHVTTLLWSFSITFLLPFMTQVLKEQIMLKNLNNTLSREWSKDLQWMETNVSRMGLLLRKSTRKKL